MLKPINAQTQAPLGIFKVDATWLAAGIEGGYCGALVADGYGIKVTNATSTYTTANSGYVIGLVDDSSTGSGYGTYFGSLAPAASAATLIGPSTIVGSGKVSVWSQSGLYVTDQLTGFTAGSSENALIYSTTGTGKLTTSSGSNGAAVGRVLCQTGSDSGILQSLVSPVVEVGTATKLYVIYFIGNKAV